MKAKAPQCVQNTVGTMNKADNWILSKSSFFRKLTSLGYSEHIVEGLFADEKAFLYNQGFIDEVLKSGKAFDIMSTLAEADSEIIFAINSCSSSAATVSFVENYSVNGAKILSKCGEDAITAVSKLNDDVAASFVDTLAERENTFFEFVDECGDNYLEKLADSFEADTAKLSGWQYKPDYELYVRNKAVYDNPKYFNQTNGAINWPENDGFWLEKGEIQDVILEKGTIIDRYGYDSGSFTSPQGIPYEMRSLSPGTNAKPYSVFEVVEPINVKSGYIAPWFDQLGGGIQYKMSETIENLLKEGKIRRIS